MTSGVRDRMSSPVRIVDHCSEWMTLYEEEKHRILDAIGQKAVAIEHIGSTAVPDLGGKPIIDIMVGVHQSAHADECIPLLQNLGYTDVIPEPDEPDWYYCLSKVYQGQTKRLKNYHLHLVKFMSNHWKKHLLFRDYLRAHPEKAKEYYELKKALADKFGSDREGYTEAKTSFIKSMITKAKDERC